MPDEQVFVPQVVGSCAFEGEESLDVTAFSVVCVDMVLSPVATGCRSAISAAGYRVEDLSLVTGNPALTQAWKPPCMLVTSYPARCRMLVAMAERPPPRH